MSTERGVKRVPQRQAGQKHRSGEVASLQCMHLPGEKGDAEGECGLEFLAKKIVCGKVEIENHTVYPRKGEIWIV